MRVLICLPSNHPIHSQAALSTASEKSNRAREAMDQRDAMRAGIDGLIEEGVAKASELLEIERVRFHVNPPPPPPPLFLS